MRRPSGWEDGATALARMVAARPRRADLARFFVQLRSSNRRSALRALADGVLVVLTLQLRGARPLFARRHRVPATTSDPARAVQVAGAVDAALGLLPVSASCLRRSVTLLRELDRLGLAASLHIGVRKAGDALEAHAWVQAGDVVVNDDRQMTDGYAEMASGDLERLFPLLH